MPPDMRSVSDIGVTAPILHSPMHSVLTSIEVKRPMTSSRESSVSRPTLTLNRAELRKVAATWVKANSFGFSLRPLMREMRQVDRR